MEFQSNTKYQKTTIGNIPYEWKLTTIEDATEAIIDYRGKTPKKTKSGIPLITAKIVKKGRISEPNEFISHDTYERWMRRGLPKSGDVVITTEAPLGEVAQLDDKIVALAQRIIILRGKKNIVNNDFLKYVLQSPMVQNEIKKRETGTTVTGIKQSELRKVLIPIPNINEQNEISSILKNLDDKIEVNIKIIKYLEQLSDILYKRWFVDYEFPNENNLSYRSNEGKMKKTELKDIPIKWNASTLNSLFEIKRVTVKPDSKNNYNHYSIPSLDENIYPVYENGKNIKSNKYVVFDDTILLSKLNPRFYRIWLPYNDHYNKICSTEFIVYKPLIEKSLYYGYLLLKSEHIKEEMLAHATGSTGSRQRVRPDDTLEFNIILPESKLIKNFNELVKPYRIYIQNNIKENIYLLKLRDVLLPRLMSGEIRVPMEDL